MGHNKGSLWVQILREINDNNDQISIKATRSVVVKVIWVLLPPVLPHNYYF